MQKILILKGRPRIIDRLQASSLDAVDTIVAWLKPKPAENAKLATSAAPASPSRTSESSKPQGGNFQIERLLALRDAHLVAPSKNLTARQRLDADFFEAPKPVVVTRSTAAPAPAPCPLPHPRRQRQVRRLRQPRPPTRRKRRLRRRSQSPTWSYWPTE